MRLDLGGLTLCELVHLMGLCPPIGERHAVFGAVLATILIFKKSST
jgi:hypothetical protein